MDEETRQELLDRVNSQSATVGARLPETITVGGNELHLPEFLIETRKVEGVPPDARETVNEALVSLRNERKQLIERLKTEDLDVEAAEELAETIVGIDRAVNALENLRRPTFGEEARSASLDDHKRWKNFLDTIKD